MRVLFFMMFLSFSNLLATPQQTALDTTYRINHREVEKKEWNSFFKELIKVKGTEVERSYGIAGIGCKSYYAENKSKKEKYCLLFKWRGRGSKKFIFEIKKVDEIRYPNKNSNKFLKP